MTVELIRRQESMTYTNIEWAKAFHLALRYGWKPQGAKLSHSAKIALETTADPPSQPSVEQAAERPRGFDESTWAFILDSIHGIPPDHPLAYCSDVLLYCQDPVLGSYSDQSRVAAADAKALAAALEKALPHMPEGPERFQDHKPGALFNPMEWIDIRSLEHLRKLIAFCKGGAFKIDQ